MVVVASALRAEGRPAAHVAVVDRLGVRRARGLHREQESFGVEYRRLEAGLGGPVVGHVVVDAKDGCLASAAAEHDPHLARRHALEPWSWSTYEQIWSTAPAFTWRASLVSATS